ncbi:TRAP transporter substrate-binding protein [Pseudobacillus badius]|uniref:TRAP transporter substrate-binding protein n=1 Tax=Bacillus badius TaxID=1455 RepID=UPI000596BBBD|nr:TRAP transporter substrate-binding protein [Bacillus badius]KIL73907.1 TRAP-type C4-dicarboxylate transport system, periplasmic component [Bacillus badius]GLY12642.1 C4-dicarboxylate ABC transporter [Bacillus badius]
MRKVKFKSIFLSFIAIVLILSGCSAGKEAGTVGADGEKVVIRMANLVSDNNFLNIGYGKFKEVAEKESNGQIEVQIYNNGTLTPSEDMEYEMLQTGVIDVVTNAAFVVASNAQVPAYNIFDVPFLFSNEEEMYKLTDGKYGEVLKRDLEKNSNAYYLGAFSIGSFAIANNKREVREPADLKGLKVRSTTTPLQSGTISAMGANPTPISYGEIFTSLQQGTIDGVQTTTPLIHADRFYEVADHLTLTRHFPLPHIMMVNKEFYNGLTDELKAVVDKAAEEQIQYARELAIKAEKDAIQAMKKEGVEVVEPTPEELELFKQAVQPAIDNNIDKVGVENYEMALDILGKSK